MTSKQSPVDVIYIAASRRDGRFTRICVASVRRFYPEAPVRLLVGGPLEPGLADELATYWDVGVADLPPGDYGWGFVKLEPLFGPPGERFLVLDSDTVMTGPVLQHVAGRAEDFVVDDETQTAERAREIYFDCDQAAREGMTLQPAEFLFNSGQWFGRSGILTRDDFHRLIQWGWPPRLTNPRVFKNGDQGVLNLVLNDMVRQGRISVARAPLMRWPGHGMEGLSAEAVAKGDAAARVVHWAGFKNPRLSALPGADLLEFYERAYYGRIPGRELRRQALALARMFDAYAVAAATRARLMFPRIRAKLRFGAQAVASKP